MKITKALYVSFLLSTIVFGIVGVAMALCFGVKALNLTWCVFFFGDAILALVLWIDDNNINVIDFFLRLLADEDDMTDNITKR